MRTRTIHFIKVTAYTLAALLLISLFGCSNLISDSLSEIIDDTITGSDGRITLDGSDTTDIEPDDGAGGDNSDETDSTDNEGSDGNGDGSTDDGSTDDGGTDDGSTDDDDTTEDEIPDDTTTPPPLPAGVPDIPTTTALSADDRFLNNDDFVEGDNYHAGVLFTVRTDNLQPGDSVEIISEYNGLVSDSLVWPLTVGEDLQPLQFRVGRSNLFTSNIEQRLWTQVVDAAGEVSNSEAITFIKDSVIPNAPQLQTPDALEDGLLDSTEIAAGLTIRITGIHYADTTGIERVALFDGQTEIGSLVASDGVASYSFELAADDPALTDGEHRLTTRVYDGAGNPSQPSPELLYSVIRTTP